MSKAQMKLGDTVHVTVHPGQNNGSSVAAGQVVRVLNVDDDNTRLNLRVMVDGDETLLLRNVPLLTKKESEEDDAPAVYCWKP